MSSADLFKMFTVEQIQSFRRAFDTIAENHPSKVVGVSDLGEILRLLGFSPDELEIQDIIDDMNISRDEKLTFDAFMTIMIRKFSDIQIRQVFKVFDADCDGVINIHELRATMERLGEKLSDGDLYEMIKDADVDGDGLINYDDFSKIMRAP